MIGDLTTRNAYLLCYLFSVLLQVAIGYVVGYRSEMRARRLFSLHVGVIILSTLLSAVALFIPDPRLHQLLWILWTVGALGAALTAFVFVSEFTGRSWRDSRVVQGMVVVWVAITAVLLTEPIHGLYWRSTTLLTTPFPHLSVTTGPVRVVGVAFTLVATGLTLSYLLELYFRTRHRPGTALLILVGGFALSVVPFFASQFGSLPVPTYNHLAFGYAVVAATFGLAAVRLDLAITAPVARDIAIENLPDPYIAVDDSGRIVDFNAALAELCDGVGGAAIGRPVEDVVPALVDRGLVDDDRGQAEIAITHQGRERWFESRSSALHGPRGERQGTEYVLRDITPLREREAELALLKDVFSRTFRHNIRNELIVVQGNAEAAAGAVDDEEVSEQLGRVLASADRLLSHMENARAIETVVDSRPEVVAADLRAVVDRALAGLDACPDTTIDVGVKPVDVLLIAGFEQAIQSAVENAVEHNPAPVRIELTATAAETVELRIEDDGQGISRHEQRVIEESIEHPLAHGSGVGLWLIKWFVTKSGGELSVENTGHGTVITMTLLRPD